MAQQIYRKEKVREKKNKIDHTERNLSYLKDRIKFMSNSFTKTRFSGFKDVEQYFSLCEKYRLNFNIKTMTKEDIDYTINIIKENEAKNVLISKKKKGKDDLFTELLARKNNNFNEGVFAYTNSTQEQLTANESVWRQVLAPFEKNKKRFLKSLTKKQARMLTCIACNKNNWVREPSDFVFYSKNLNGLISEYASFVLWEYPTTEMERALFLSAKSFERFQVNKSFEKTLKENNYSYPLTKKQIARLKNYKPFIEWDSINDVRREFFIFDIIGDQNATRALLNENYTELFAKYCHYVKNRIFADDFFDKKQIKPVYDYVKEQERETIRAQNEARAEANDPKIHFYYHLEHHEPYVLYEGMQKWHRKLYKTKNSVLKVWDKSKNISEWKKEKFRNTETEADKYKHQNYSVETIVELNTSAELSEEGRNMKHCVGSYAKSCASGKTRIFSLRKKPFSNHFVKSYATIQVHNEERIVQAASFKNDPLTIEDKNIIAKWAKENKLSWY